MHLFLFLFGIFQANLALAQLNPVQIDFKPFEFDNAQINQRPDISGTIPRMQTSGTRYFGTDLIHLQFGDTKVAMFSEIGGLLVTAHNSPLDPAPISSLLDNCKFSEIASHTSHEKLSGQVAERVNDAAQATSKICKYVYHPELVLNEVGIENPSLSQLLSLEGLMRVLGRPMSLIELPAYMRNDQTVSIMRNIFAKVRYNDLKDDLKKAANKISIAEKFLAREGSNANDWRLLLSQVKTEQQNAFEYLAKIKHDGLMQAEQDRKNVEALGRKRQELPHPSLTDNERRFLAVVVGGSYWRMRGGGLYSLSSTQKARLFFNRQPMTILGDLAGSGDGLAAGEAIFAQIFNGWGEWMDMGTTPGDQDQYHDLVMATNRGLQQVEFAARELQNKGYDSTSLIMGGLQLGPCYLTSLKLLSNVGVATKFPYPVYQGDFLNGFTAWGEFCTGASITLGLVDTLLAGKR
jgi:hypothetical protein